MTEREGLWPEIQQYSGGVCFDNRHLYCLSHNGFFSLVVWMKGIGWTILSISRHVEWPSP